MEGTSKLQFFHVWKEFMVTKDNPILQNCWGTDLKLLSFWKSRLWKSISCFIQDNLLNKKLHSVPEQLFWTLTRERISNFRPLKLVFETLLGNFDLSKNFQIWKNWLYRIDLHELRSVSILSVGTFHLWMNASAAVKSPLQALNLSSLISSVTFSKAVCRPQKKPSANFEEQAVVCWESSEESTSDSENILGFYDSASYSIQVYSNWCKLEWLQFCLNLRTWILIQNHIVSLQNSGKYSNIQSIVKKIVEKLLILNSCVLVLFLNYTRVLIGIVLIKFGFSITCVCGPKNHSGRKKIDPKLDFIKLNWFSEAKDMLSTQHKHITQFQQVIFKESYSCDSFKQFEGTWPEILLQN